MLDAAAHALLHKKLGDKGTKSGSNSDINNDFAELAATLDHMPLALVQAAAYIRQRARRDAQCSSRSHGGAHNIVRTRAHLPYIAAPRRRRDGRLYFK